MNWKIQLFKMYWEDDDIQALASVIKRGTFWATGPEIECFERNISHYVGTTYGISFNSGTSALHAVLLAHGITSGDVIVPSFTFIATANAVVLAGAKPVFAETEPVSYGLNAEDVQNRITKKTKAIIPIHYGGSPSKDIKALREIADDHHIFLIEDAAESLGAKLDSTMVGTFGHSAMFSFCQNKVITTGEGGMIVTDSEDVYQKLKLIRSHGRFEETPGDYFFTIKEMDYIQVGYNFRMPTLCAALGVSQFHKLQKTVRMRQENAHYLTSLLSKYHSVTCPVELPHSVHVYQMYTIQLPDKKTRDGLQQQLYKDGIMTKVYFDPIHLKTYYRKLYGCKKGQLPDTEALSDRILTLPMYPTLTTQEMDCIGASFNTYFGGSKP